MSEPRGRGLPSAELASAFRRQDGRPAPPEPPTAEEPPTRRTTPEAPRPSARRASARPAAHVGRLVLWTPVAVRARMQAVQAEHGTLYRDQVLDAIEETVDDLPALVAAAVGGDTAVRGRLFERRPPVRRPQVEQRVQLTIGGFLPSQLVIIDELVASSGASSRSALVNAALDAALPPLP